MGTLGETTSKSLAAVIQQANGPGGGRVPGAAGAKYHGGYGGGAGTWGRVPTGRGGAPQLPLSALHRNVPTASQTGRRSRVRANAEGTRSLWDTLPEKALPKPPAKGNGRLTASAPRPHTAKPRGTAIRDGRSIVPQELAFCNTGGGFGPDHVSSGAPARPRSPHTCSRPEGAPSSPTTRSSMPRGGPEAIMSALSCGMTPTSPAAYPSAAACIEARSEPDDCVGGVPAEASPIDDPGDMTAHSTNMAEILLERLRKALRKARTVYEGEHALLEKACLQADDGAGELDAAACAQVFAQIGVQASAADTEVLIRCQAAGAPRITCAALSTLLLADRSRLLAAELPCRRGAFVAGEAAAGVRECKIVYPQCKTPAFTPSSWAEAGVGAACVARSSAVPDTRLQLEFVYGYEGVNNTGSNVFYNCQRQIVYYTAAVVIIYTSAALATTSAPHLAGEAHTQRFFLAHDDDIRALAPCQAAVDVDGVQYPAHSLFASGQVTRSTHGPYVCIWDSRCSAPTQDGKLRRIQLAKDARGVCALAFSPGGRFLVVVTMDTSHTVLVHDWRARRVLSTGRGYAGEPTQVYGALWNPFLDEAKAAEFVTWGRKHCKLWTQQPPPQSGKPPAHAGWTPFQLSFGRHDVQNVHSAAFLPATHALALGLARGEVLIVERGQAVRSIVAHRPGPQAIRADGSISYGGLRGMALAQNNTALVTAGADGQVHTWDVRDGMLAEADRLRTVKLAPVCQLGPSEKPPAVRALAVDPATGAIILGTAGCDIVEVGEGRQDVLVHGQAGALHAVAWHPVQHAVFATACEAPRVCVCDAACRDVVKTAAVGFAVRACAWSPVALNGSGGHHLCLGGADGRLAVLEEATLRCVWQARDSQRGIADVKYSPSGHAVAAATMDRHVDVYRTGTARYARVARCRGHSSVVRHVDWSADGAALRSMCSAYELLHWHARSGKQLTASARDVEWATWTCTLGFPVMGVWPVDADGTDVNAADRHPGGALVATADDGGAVKLFNYPCVVEDAPHRAYSGHSAHVTCVRFSADGARLVSVGGADRAAFQFRVEAVRAPPPPPLPSEAAWGTVDGKVYGWTRCLPQDQDTAHRADSLRASQHGGAASGEENDRASFDEGRGDSVCGAQGAAHEDALLVEHDSTGGW